MVITGSFAASRLAPVASPAMLLAYASTPGRLASELELLPAAPLQVAVDCLTGNGRMPAEGEALLESAEAWLNG
jgi:hypothetical protein